MRRLRLTVVGILAVGLMVQGQVKNSKNEVYLHKGLQPTQIREIARAIGKRTESPGAERLSLSGTISSRGGAAAPVTLLFEWPNRVRVQSTGQRAAVFDGDRLSSSSGTATVDEQDLAEMLAFDSVEGFLRQAAQRRAIRLVDSATTVADSRVRNPLRGVCELYLLEDEQAIRGSRARTGKMFCFDAATKLLKSVAYQRNGLAVETRYEEWRITGEHRYPARIRRLLGDQEILVLDLPTATVAAKNLDTLLQTP